MRTLERQRVPPSGTDRPRFPNCRRPPVINARFVLALPVFAAAFVPASAQSTNSGHWLDLAPMNTARQEVGAARIGNRVYVVGGLLAGSPLQATPTVEA